MSTIDQKFIAAGLVLAAWFALVVLGLAPVAQYIDALRDILLGLGVYHTINNLQSVQKDPPKGDV